MKNVILFDDENWTALLPLTYTKPVGELRVGILTIKQKWERLLHAEVSYITQDYLSVKYPFKLKDDNYIINSSILPIPFIVDRIKELEPNSAIVWGEKLVASRIDRQHFDAMQNNQLSEELKGVDISAEDEVLVEIKRPFDIFKCNRLGIELDYELLTENRKSEPLPAGNRYSNPENIFIESGAKISNSILNASEGPIYIAEGAEIMDGSIIKGPFAMLEGSVVKMGAKIYGPTTLGPFSKVGGEVNNVVFQGFSNKGHDGFIGDSVIGEWCNLGADTNCSNLKNNYSTVKMYNYASESFESTEAQFCGLVMGDHAKCGINTMFNTGTVVGFGANVFGSGFPQKFIPGFTWGAIDNFETYKLDKFLEVAAKVLKRRTKSLTQADLDIIRHIFHFSARYRHWPD